MCSWHVLYLWIKTLPRIPKNNRGKKETHLGCSKERNQKAKKVTLASRLYPHFSWGSLGPPAWNPLSLDHGDFNMARRQEGRLETPISHVGNPHFSVVSVTYGQRHPYLDNPPSDTWLGGQQQPNTNDSSPVILSYSLHCVIAHSIINRRMHSLQIDR